MAWDTEHALNPETTQSAPGQKFHGRAWICLPKRSDFLRVGASGIRRATPGFVLQSAPNPEPATLRIGFTASRKVGNAVARNRVKRRLRALVDKVMPDAADHSRDYVLIGRTETLTRDFAVLERELRATLKKLSDKKLTDTAVKA